jgi:hypothetical protein
MGTTPPTSARYSDGRICARSNRTSLRDRRPRRRLCSARLLPAGPRSCQRTGSSASARKAGGCLCLTLSRRSGAYAETPQRVSHRIPTFQNSPPDYTGLQKRRSAR